MAVTLITSTCGFRNPVFLLRFSHFLGSLPIVLMTPFPQIPIYCIVASDYRTPSFLFAPELDVKWVCVHVQFVVWRRSMRRMRRVSQFRNEIPLNEPHCFGSIIERSVLHGIRRVSCHWTGRMHTSCVLTQTYHQPTHTANYQLF